MAKASGQNIAPRGAITHRDGNVALPNGRRLHYVDYGGEGETVLALPGHIQNAHAFDGIAPALVPHVRLLALDMRGRGGSDWGPAQEYRMNFYLQDLRAFLDALGLERIALIGTSLGGLLAIFHALAYPSDVTRLVLNDATLNGDLSAAAGVVQRYGRAPARFASLADALQWFFDEHVLDGLDDDACEAWVSHFLTPLESGGGFRFHCDPALLQQARNTRLYLGQNRFPTVLVDRAKRLKMPVLILRGAESDVVSQDEARVMAQSMAAGHWTDVPGAGHSPTLYEPEAQTALRKFFGIPSRDRR